MGLRVNNNIQSINAHRNLTRNDMKVGVSLERLSSGLRINKAADDAAGLVISEQMRAQITSTQQAIDNSETAVNMIQTAEGAMDEVNSLLSKVRQLALHAANEAPNDINQLVADQAELDNAIGAITRIAEQTQFGTKKLLDGTLSALQNFDSSKIEGYTVESKLLTRSDFTGGDVNLRITSSAATRATLSAAAGNIGSMLVTSQTLSAFMNDADNAIKSGVSLEVTVGDQKFTFLGGATSQDIKDTINRDSDYTVKTTDGDQVTLEAKVAGVSAAGGDLKFEFFRSSYQTSGSIDTVSATVSMVIGTQANNGYNTIIRMDGASFGGTAVELGATSAGGAGVFLDAEGTSTAGSTIADTLGEADNKLNSGASITFNVEGTDYTFSNEESVQDMLKVINEGQDTYDLRADRAYGIIAVRNTIGDSGTNGDLSITVTDRNGVSSVLEHTDAEEGRDVTASLNGSGLPGGTIALSGSAEDGSMVENKNLGIAINLEDGYAMDGDDAVALRMQMSRGALFQVGPNGGQSAAIDVKSIDAKTLGQQGDASGVLTNLQSLVDSQALVNGLFEQALDVIDKSIDDVTSIRGELGAFQANTLEANISSLQVSKENLTAAESTIRDVDFAAESAAFSKNQIMTQAATAMMAQANQLPQNVMQLLG